MTPEQIAMEQARTGNVMKAIRGEAAREAASDALAVGVKDPSDISVYDPETNTYKRNPLIEPKKVETGMQEYARQKTADAAVGLPSVPETHRTSQTNFENADKSPQIAPKVKTPTDSAIELADASPSKVGQVIAKLKEEEAKGGPNFFDVIEAAAAGWNGQIPKYVKQELAKAQDKSDLEKIRQAAAIQEQERQASFADALQLEKLRGSQDIAGFEREANLRRELAGLPSIGGAALGKGAQLAQAFLAGGKK